MKVRVCVGVNVGVDQVGVVRRRGRLTPRKVARPSMWESTSASRRSGRGRGASGSRRGSPCPRRRKRRCGRRRRGRAAPDRKDADADLARKLGSDVVVHRLRMKDERRVSAAQKVAVAHGRPVLRRRHRRRRRRSPPGGPARTDLSLRRILRTLKPLRSAVIEINGLTQTIPPALGQAETAILDALRGPRLRH